MSFFVTSAGSATAPISAASPAPIGICQTLAAAAGGGSKTWHAYLSAAAANGQPAVNARDRIGAGPWYNAKGARIAQNVADLHGDTLEQARRGNNMTKVTALTEKGDTINGVGDTPNRHDMLTGSQLDGTAFTDGADHTCGNWTSGATGTVQLGHHDRTGGGNTSWNSTHPSRGCSQENLVAHRRRRAVLLLRDQLMLSMPWELGADRLGPVRVGAGVRRRSTVPTCLRASSGTVRRRSHSARSASIGSTVVARHAGPRQAIAAGDQERARRPRRR